MARLPGFDGSAGGGALGVRRAVSGGAPPTGRGAARRGTSNGRPSGGRPRGSCAGRRGAARLRRPPPRPAPPCARHSTLDIAARRRRAAGPGVCAGAAGPLLPRILPRFHRCARAPRRRRCLPALPPPAAAAAAPAGPGLRPPRRRHRAPSTPGAAPRRPAGALHGACAAYVLGLCLAGYALAQALAGRPHGRARPPPRRRPRAGPRAPARSFAPGPRGARMGRRRPPCPPSPACTASLACALPCLRRRGAPPRRHPPLGPCPGPNPRAARQARGDLGVALRRLPIGPLL
jgi:hypothetical protein